MPKYASTQRSAHRAADRGRADGAQTGRRAMSNRAVGRLRAASAPLRVGVAGSSHERDADRAADAVLAGRPSGARVSDPVAGGAPVAAGVQRQIERARGGGRGLTGRLRTRLQRSFSADLSGIRVHTDDRAHRVARDLGAAAATVGRDIFFRRGALRGRGGLHTLAHEVAHATQPGAAGRVQCRKWYWQKEYRGTKMAWRSGPDEGPHILEDIGEGKTEKDQWDDETRVYTPQDPYMRRPKFSESRYIPSAENTAQFKARDEKRAKAGELLRGVKTLSALAKKLDDVGYDYSTLPATYIEATSDYKTFKKKKTWMAGGRAKLACRLALRDLQEGLGLASKPDETYMLAARRREETVDKSDDFTGDYKWDQFGYAGSTDFGKWALGEAGKPTTKQTLNCWEAVLLAAHEKGFVSRTQIRDKYIESKAIQKKTATPSTDLGHARTPGVSDEDQMVPIEEILVRGAGKHYDPTNPYTARPLTGDILAVGSFGNHTMIAKGNTDDPPKVYSCWPQYTGDVDTVREQPITDFTAKGLGTKIWMYRPFWA